ncbi:hypothetical protein [Catelliglobosispora koreensis]|uniref:hypothetical protein n=1 Tax=Catelliglobosispora koreensis TaxID=129052 RepID=UPI0012FCB6E5|nr:hypothetical protein [Catelliglobosispora koreensis]
MHEDAFKELLQASIEADRTAAELAARAAAVRAAIQAQTEAIALEFERRDAALEGTDPESALGVGGSTLCRQFLEFMATKGYPRSVGLSGPHKPEKTRRSLWKRRPLTAGAMMRGYPIGVLSDYRPDRVVDRLPIAFLCEDGKLRRARGTVLEGGMPLRFGVVDRERDGSYYVLPPHVGTITYEEYSIPCNCPADSAPHDCRPSKATGHIHRPMDLATLLITLAKGV